MPSPQFIKSYFSSFTDDIISQPLQKGEKKDEDKDKEGEAAEVTARSVRGRGSVAVGTTSRCAFLCCFVTVVGTSGANVPLSRCVAIGAVVHLQ